MSQDPAPEPELETLVRRHLRIGWWSILVFLTLGLALETLYGFKIGWYLDVSNETRRLMWRLAHAHGVLLGLLHVAFALTLRQVGGERPRLISATLTSAGILLPGGFLLGGLVVHGGDPGRGVLLVPIGAALLFGAVLGLARRL